MSTQDKFDLIYDEKDPAEVWRLAADFGEFTTPLTSVVLTITRLSGSADSNPSAMKTGGPQVQGTGRATHLVQGGVDGADYAIRWDVIGDGETLTLVGRLPVRKKKAP